MAKVLKVMNSIFYGKLSCKNMISPEPDNPARGKEHWMTDVIDRIMGKKVA